MSFSHQDLITTSTTNGFYQDLIKESCQDMTAIFRFRSPHQVLIKFRSGIGCFLIRNTIKLINTFRDYWV